VLGVTGAPGAGKSTLVDRLAVDLAAAGRRVGVVAVDPSSAFSGGAILGDRIRMQRAADVPGLFIRSMATRGHLGGLARATEDAVDLLDAFGFDDIILETVGVGQDEIEVVQVAHVNVVVLVPFMGDDVQAIKAGIMEIADVFVINKADREGADRLETHLRMMMQLVEHDAAHPPPEVPILRTVATRGEGVSDLLEAVGRLWSEADPGRRQARRRERVRSRLGHLLRDRLLERHLAVPGMEPALEAAVERVLAREQDPYGATTALLRGGGPRIDHVGIAVPEIPGALSFWRDVVGLPLAHEETVGSESVRVAMLPAGDGRVELLEPTGEQGAVAGFLAKRGPGIHHLCLEVADLEAVLARLRAAGATVVGEAPRRGAEGKLVAFVHPKSATGVLLELSQPASAGEGEHP